MQSHIKSLINYVKSVRTYQENVLDVSGERFNVFKILNLSASETRTHSAFVGELLNPKGSHGMGATFLRLFLKQFGLNHFKVENTTVLLEKFIGTVNEDQTMGGRLDILISNENRQGIVIENKIYAQDQRNQLSRYRQFCQAMFDEYNIFYLTLEGLNPTELSIEVSASNITEQTTLKSISYKIEIIEWLRQCMKEVADKPLIRETIIQYINLLNHLTGQTMSDSMNTEIVKGILKDGPEAMKAVFEIKNAIYPAIAKVLYSQFSKQIKTAFKASYQLELNEDNLGNNTSGFYLSREDWSSISIGFAFERGYPYYGICRNRSRWEDAVSNEVQSNVQSALGPAPKTAHWPWWQWYYKNEGPEQIFLDIDNGSLIKGIEERVSEIARRLDQSKMKF
jgi:hypothetical protein